MQIRYGVDASGRRTVRLEIERDDPLAPVIIGLSRRGALALRDTATGFIEHRSPSDESVRELEEIILALLPAEAREVLLADCESLKAHKQHGTPLSYAEMAMPFLASAMSKMGNSEAAINTLFSALKSST